MTRIACVQLAPRIGEVEANLSAATAAIADAVGRGADIVVLPELATSGYVFVDDTEARAAALPAGDPAFAAWVRAAGAALVVAGFCELGDDGLLYNSALVISEGAVVACYRKTHLWDREKLIFTPGAEPPPVLRSRYGVVAVMVCYDLEFPELTRRVALDNAELIVAPVNWPAQRTPPGERCGEMITAMSAARTNRVAIAVCDRAGAERGCSWAEATGIIDPDGWVVAEVGPGPGIAMAAVDLTASRNKALTEYVHLFADRRPELY